MSTPCFILYIILNRDRPISTSQPEHKFEPNPVFFVYHMSSNFLSKSDFYSYFVLYNLGSGSWLARANDNTTI